MDRFINVKKHDEVYSRKFGDGYFVEYDSTQPDGPYVFCFPKLNDGKGLSIGYYPTGKLDIEDIEPDLFYRKGEERYLTERPKTKPGINWTEWEGKEIEVYNDNTKTWIKRKFVKHLPEKAYPFLCEHANCSDSYSGWAKARLIEEEKETEIDWSKVPIGTKVKASNISIEDARQCRSHASFLLFYHNTDYPFFIFNLPGSISTSAYVFKYCVLAEPAKPEWLKKDS